MIPEGNPEAVLKRISYQVLDRVVVMDVPPVPEDGGKALGFVLGGPSYHASQVPWSLDAVTYCVAVCYHKYIDA